MPLVDIKTKIPGPKSNDYLERLKGTVKAYQLFPTFIDHADGPFITDVDGNRFYDWSSGCGVNVIGNRHPRIVEAVNEQMSRYSHHEIYQQGDPLAVEYVEKILETLDGELKQGNVWFGNSGSEAVENAMKLAMRRTHKGKFISFHNAFHGRTLGVLNFTEGAAGLEGFQSLLGHSKHVSYPYCYRCEDEYSSCEMGSCVGQIYEVLKNEISPREVAGIIAEPVLGEGGFVIPPKEMLVEVRKICDKYDIQMIVDEVQTFTKTGKWWAHQHSDVVPDIITTAKAAGGGLPLSLVIYKPGEPDTSGPGFGSTYAPSPLALAAASATLDVIRDDNLIERSVETEKIVRDAFSDYQKDFSFIGDVRSIGALGAMEMVKDRKTKEQNYQISQDLRETLFRKGVITFPPSLNKNTFRVFTQLNVDENHLKELLEMTYDSLSELRGGQK